MILDGKRPDVIFFRNGKIQLINAVVFTGIFSLLVLLGYVYNSVSQIPKNVTETNEKVWREQARRELTNLKIQLIEDIKSGLVDVDDDKSLQKWASLRLAHVRNGGDTSDGFMIELFSEKFISDGSPDCGKEEFVIKGRFMRDEVVVQSLAKEYFIKNDFKKYKDKNIITASDLIELEKSDPSVIKYFRENKYILHKDYVLAERMLDEMRANYDTNASSMKWWQFDDSRELLEWIIVPAPRTGFNNEPNTLGGIKNIGYRAVLIQIGTQEDEINNSYKYINVIVNGIKIIFIGIGLLLMMLASLFMINILFLQEECNNCPLRKII